MDYPDAPSLEAAIRALGDSIAPGQTWGKLVEHLLGEYVEPTLIQPTIIMDYPRDISPFAKRVSYDDVHVERFEFYIAGMEMGNAFTELNDPRDQEARFLEMARLFREDDDDATPTRRGLSAGDALRDAAQRRFRHGRGSADDADDQSAHDPRRAALSAPARTEMKRR